MRCFFTRSRPTHNIMRNCICCKLSSFVSSRIYPRLFEFRYLLKKQTNTKLQLNVFVILISLMYYVTVFFLLLMVLTWSVLSMKLYLFLIYNLDSYSFTASLCFTDDQLKPRIFKPYDWKLKNKRISVRRGMAKSKHIEK